MLTVDQEQEVGRSVFREANDAFLIIRPSDLRVIDVNPCAQRLTGRRRKHLLEMSVQELLESDDPQALNGLVNACQTTVYLTATDGFWLRANDGSRRPVQISVSRIHTDPEPCGLLIVRDVSRQRQMEESLGQSEQRYRVLVEQAGVVFWEADPVTDRFTYVSGHARDMLGYPVEQWYEPDFWVEHLHPDDRSWVAQSCRQQAASGVPYNLEYRMIAADNHVVWLRDLCTSVWRDGRLVGQRGVMVDISLEKHEHEALAAAQGRLHSIAEYAPGFIVQVDRQGKIEYINRVPPHLVKQEVLGTSMYDWAEQDYRPQMREALERVFLDGQSQSVECVAEGQDGRSGWYDIRMAPLFVDGRVAGAILIAHDITERKRHEDALRAAELELRYQKTLLECQSEASPDGIVVVDPKGQWVSFNTRFVEMWRVPADVVAARSNPPALQASLGQFPDGFMSRAGLLSGDADRAGHEEVLSKDGRVFDRYSAPVQGDDGTHYGRVWYYRDITDRKRDQSQLQQHLADLAHALRLSTMGELTGAMAHEVNQPLAAIANFAGGGIRRLAIGEVDRDTLSNVLGQIAEQALRAGDIVRRMRNFTQKRGPQRSSHDINDLVREVVRIVESEARLAGIRLWTDLDAQLPLVHVDGIQIEQVMLNLVRNAFDAMSDTAADERDLHLRTVLDGPKLVRVSVADRGCGLDPIAAARLFDPFVTTKPNGMGLGLSISRSIVESHGGRIWTTPNPDGGAIFSFNVLTDGEREHV